VAEILALRLPRQFAREQAYPAWLWPNLLGLDAPVVALIWQDYLARHFAFTLPPAGRTVLALTVRAIHLLDHLVDVHHPLTDSWRRCSGAAKYITTPAPTKSRI
jgi:hypothetical protein